MPGAPRVSDRGPDFAFDRVLVCGIGLIGGSVARALRRMHREGRAGGAGVIAAADPHAAALTRALALGMIDEACVLAPVEGSGDDAAPVAADAGGWGEAEAAAFARLAARADLIVLAAPVAQTRALLAHAAPVLRADAVLTDVGSTKGQVCDAARELLGPRHARFVAAHPIAGGEASGVDAGDAALFAGRDVILCPAPDTAPDAVTRVAAMWRLAGARTACMTPARHDQLFAGVSHLPHLLAFAFIEHILQSEGADERLAFAGPGFRDFTRIAASNPRMWRDICLANRTAVLADLDRYLAVLGGVRTALAEADGDTLEALFSRSRAAREGWHPGAARVESTAAPATAPAASHAGNRNETADDLSSTAGKPMKNRNI